MDSVPDTLSGIAQRADGALAPDLHQMTQEILALRTQLALDHSTRADTLLLTLDRLQHCGHTHTATPRTPQRPEAAPALQREVLALDTLQPLQPSHYLVHFYSHDHGDLERVALTETLCAAAQLVHTYLLERPRLLHVVLQRERDGALAFMSGDAMVLASIEPSEPCTPDVAPAVADACAALHAGDLTALQRLFVTAPVLGLERRLS
jgi:hypothetical protein